MSLEKEECRSSEDGSEKFDAAIKKPKFSYDRDFLFSLRDLDVCKKLPNGFDESLLSEFEDVGQSIPDQSRIPGSHSLQGFRRNQYGSSPPTRGDSSNYSRSTYGRSDSDSQSERESDSGRRYGHPSRRSWQTTEQDGLLGSGSCPRPPGHVSGVYAPKFRVNGDHHLSKSNEPYHPPRAYKPVPYSRRDTDSYNDETFGSMECENEDRAQEERRRRASFEMIRKEQQKALQDKQKLNLKHNSAIISNLSEVLEDKKEEMGSASGQKELEGSSTTVVVSNNLDTSFSLQASASRPLVPPGFRNGILEKGSGLKYQSQTLSLEEQKPVPGKSLLDPKISLVPDNGSAGLELNLSQGMNAVNEHPLQRASPLEKGENEKSLYYSDLHVKKSLLEDQVVHASSRLDSHGSLDDPAIVGLNANALEGKTSADGNSKFSTSLLENIFGGALSLSNHDGSNITKFHHIKPDDTRSSSSTQTSKLSHWFPEEESKPTDDSLFGGSNDLLSLISNRDKDQCQASNSEADDFRLNFSLEKSNKLAIELPPVVLGISNKTSIDKKEESISNVITCEDLEQSMLTEYSANSINNKPPFSEDWDTTDLRTEQTREHVDDHASLHLLSLLQQGSSDQKHMSVNSDAGYNLEDRPPASQVDGTNTSVHEHKHEENENSVHNSGKSITLEKLFGSAFMKELQSVEAPISVQRESTEADAPEPLRFADNIVSSPATDIGGLQGLFASNDRQHMRPGVGESLLSLDGPVRGTISSNNGLEEVPMPDGYGTAELPPSEAKYLNHQMLKFMPAHNSMPNPDFSSNLTVDMLEKLAGINTVKDDRFVDSENVPFPHLPYQNPNPQHPYPGLQALRPSPQFQHPQMSQMRPLHHSFESPHAHMSSQMEIFGRDHMLDHYLPVNHQVPPNMIRNPLHPSNIRIMGPDAQSLASMQHQMQLSGNHSHLVPELQWGGHSPVLHPGNQAANFRRDRNSVPGFLPENYRPNIRGPGLPMPGAEGSPPPELFQRLMGGSGMGVEAKHSNNNNNNNTGAIHDGFQFRYG
ncbi:uncharacterized protein LOC127252471 [Andrographis paniculata]|uniref:uncharacterized protein LOC127252471 n=1 Tax=Andrographis paniculata TaxID=175694 RepID=UPI0021E97E5F|nr:uncharacterized protein LOC127252471 [Andrographis paniculata]